MVLSLYNMMQFKNIPNDLRKRNGAPNGKKVIIEWAEETEKVFNKLKDILCSDLVLALPHFEKDMFIATACKRQWLRSCVRERLEQKIAQTIIDQ